jgi:hypothetical protein
VINKIFYSDRDLKEFIGTLPDRSPLMNSPKEYPVLLADVVYKFHNGDFRRFLDLLYKEDCKALFHQLEDKKNVNNT